MRELRETLIQAKHRNKNFEVNMDALDDSQFEAVSSPEEKVLLRAPAGSGKTNSIITAIAAHRYEWLNDRICAITYTRAARAEMEARLQEMGIYDVEVTTIHVWCRNMLTYFSKLYDFRVRILEEKDIRSILMEIGEKYKKTHRSIKVINYDILYQYVSGNKQMDITDNYRRTLNALEERYIQYKRDNQLYDFTDYPQYLYDVLISYNEVIKDIDALFVDEFQDVDPVQLKIFEKVVDCRKKFFVGDSWQSIYVFRGADGEVFKKCKDFSAYKLKYNYRSYQEIIDYATTVYVEQYNKAENEEDLYITEIMHRTNSATTCSKGYGGTVSVVNPFGRAIQFAGQKEVRSIDGYTQLVKMLRNKSMILCRTNKQVKAVQSEYYFETSTVHQAKGLEYDNVIVIDSTIKNVEDLNIAYVAMTRARNNLLVINWNQFEEWFKGALKDSQKEIKVDDLI